MERKWQGNLTVVMKLLAAFFAVHLSIVGIRPEPIDPV